MKSKREVRVQKIMNGWHPPRGLWATLAMGFRGPGTHLMAGMRTCCADVIGEFHSAERLTRTECHAQWSALAAHVLDRCDCPHSEMDFTGPRAPMERQLAEQRRAFLDSTRDRLPVPAGWDVQEMDEVRDEIDDLHQED